MKYKNPIIQADYSDPDVIRHNDDFFMVASSFNHTPGVPVLHTKNLVDWRLINYVYDNIPIKRFDNVCHGDGAWAPSIRFNDGLFYVMIPFPDEGIFVSYTKNPFDKWSELHLLIPGRGLEDPCPIWTNGKCYVAVGFAKSRAGFNSCIGIYEVSNDLKEVLSDGYKIVYDGHNDNPTIEGPKFNERNGYYYIMAPAGSVKGGWQTALRSKNIYGPYESKIVLMQGDTLINGPHQGALIDLDDNDNWAFIHFQDMRAYGRICHLEPVMWHNDWPLPGNVGDPLLCGTPVYEHDYLVDIVSDFKIPTCDDFKDNKLSKIWQTPANIKDYWYSISNGLKLNCTNGDILNLNMLPNHFMQKVMFLNFKASSLFNFELIEDGDEVGFSIMGSKYSYVCVVRRNQKNYVEVRKGEFNKDDVIVYSKEYDGNEILFNLDATNSNIYDLNYKIGFNNMYYYNSLAYAGRWIGTKIGIYAKGRKGYAIVKYYNQEENNG